MSLRVYIVYLSQAKHAQDDQSTVRLFLKLTFFCFKYDGILYFIIVIAIDWIDACSGFNTFHIAFLGNIQSLPYYNNKLEWMCCNDLGLHCTFQARCVGF